MKFIERQTQFPGKRKVIMVDENNQPLVGEEPVSVNIVRDEGTVDIEGTPISAENLNKGNWRDDTSLSFKKAENNTLPPAKATETQIVTKDNGETWLIPPALSNKAPKELDKVNNLESGTIVYYGAQEQQEVVFDSDPQEQINSKSTIRINTVKTDVVDFDSNPQAQLNSKLPKADLLNLIYPIGSIYMSANNVSPQTFIGGTWAAWGMGRVPLGIGTPQANNDGLNTTTPSNSYTNPEVRGGLENGTASHTHSTPNHTHTLSVSVAHTWTSSGSGTSGNQSVGHTHTTPDHIHSYYSHSRASGNVSSIAGGNSNNNSTLGGPDTSGSNSSYRATYIGTGGNITATTGGGTTGAISANHTHSTPNHVHTLSSSATPSWTSSGGGTSGDSSAMSTRGNLQPYITCYMWKRTN